MNMKVTFTMFLLKTFGFLMDKIAQYENNMIYIIKKQEGFFKTRSTPASFPPVPINFRNLKVVQTPTQSEKVLYCYEKGKIVSPRKGIKPRHRSAGCLLVYCMEL